MTAKAKHQTRQKIEYRTFTFRIMSWQPSYSFSTSNDRYERGSYWEYMSMTLDGSCISPRKYEGREAKLTILGRRSHAVALMTQEEEDRKPLGVGSLTLRGAKTDYLGSMPCDAMWGVSSMLSSVSFQYIRLDGEPLYRGKSLIKNISFENEIDPDDIE